MLYIVPDTNSLMHFTRPDQLDWKTLAGTSEVEIVLTTVPVREIDKHANLHPTRRLRDRARNLKSWIRGLIAPHAAPAKVSVDVREPTAFIANGLDAGVPDDRLIASALMLQAEGKAVAIFTDDTVLQAKLPAFGLRGIWPEDDDRLKDEPDPLEAENARLARELAVFANRRPELSVAWPDGAPVLDLVVFPPPNMEDVIAPEAIRRQLPPLPDPGPAPPREPRQGPLDLAELGRMGGLGPTRDQVRSYNEDLERYHHAYADYYEQMQAYGRALGHVAALSLVAHNRGTAVATSLRASLQLPNGLKLLDPDKKIGKRPVAPDPPRKPGSTKDLLSLMGRGYLDGHLMPMVPNLHRNRDNAPYLDRQAGVISLRREKLLQHHSFPFEDAYVLIAPELVGKGGHIDARITAEELPQPTLGQLAFRVVNFGVQ